MVQFIRKSFRKEDGLGTVEVIVIIAVLVGVALIFRGSLISFVEGIMKNVFNADTVTNIIKITPTPSPKP